MPAAVTNVAHTLIAARCRTVSPKRLRWLTY
jgi:hypothetical protein